MLLKVFRSAQRIQCWILQQTSAVWISQFWPKKRCKWFNCSFNVNLTFCSLSATLQKVRCFSRIRSLPHAIFKAACQQFFNKNRGFSPKIGILVEYRNSELHLCKSLFHVSDRCKQLLSILKASKILVLYFKPSRNIYILKVHSSFQRKNCNL